MIKLKDLNLRINPSFCLVSFKSLKKFNNQLYQRGYFLILYLTKAFIASTHTACILITFIGSFGLFSSSIQVNWIDVITLWLSVP